MHALVTPLSEGDVSFCLAASESSLREVWKNEIVLAPPVMRLALRILSLAGEILVHRPEQFGAVALEGTAA